MIVMKKSMDREAVILSGLTHLLSDCLTKTITSCRLIETLSTGIFDLRPTEESLAIKAKNEKWRTLKKEQEQLQDSDT